MIWLVLVLILGIAVLVAAYKRRISAVSTGLGGINDFEDFINGIEGTPYMSDIVAGGSVRQAPWLDASTLVRLHNDSSGDTAGISTNDPNGPGCLSVVNGSASTIACSLELVGVSANTPHSRFLYGFSSEVRPFAAGGFDSYLKADRSVSNFWIAYRGNAGGGTSVVTTVPVDINSGSDTASDFITLKVITNLRSSYFYINGVLVATISTDWSASQPRIAPVASLNSTGTPDIQNVYIDYSWLIHELPFFRPSP